MNHMSPWLRSRIWYICGMVLVMFPLLVACSAARSSPSAYEAAAPAGDADVGASAAMEAPAAQPQADDQLAGELVATITRKVIASADMEVVVADTEETVDAINVLMDEVGGYVSAANLYKQNYGGADLLRGNLTLRVPAETLNDVMEQLERMAVEVRAKNIDRQDVTDQYSDVDAQIRNLEATENELRELLAEVRAKPNATPEDIMAVFRTLTEVRGQIEQLQGRRNLLDNQIALSTIDLTLIPDAVNIPVVEEGWRPTVVVRDAMRALVSALQGIGNLAIWVGLFVMPLALLALLCLAILFWILRWLFQLVNRRRVADVAS